MATHDLLYVYLICAHSVYIRACVNIINDALQGVKSQRTRTDLPVDKSRTRLTTYYFE